MREDAAVTDRSRIGLLAALPVNPLLLFPGKMIEMGFLRLER
jgi:hypothetical protein